MANGRGKKSTSAPSRGLQGITLREENVGRKHVNPHSMLKLQHLQRLATWAAREASIPPLAAHFGRMLAASAELEGIPLDRSTVSCQRCETILQPGYNCTVRIEKNANGIKRHRKSGVPRNNVVYRCNFCSHRNLRKGTPRDHMKDVLASRPRPVSESKLADSITMAISKSDKDVTDANDLNGYSECVNGNPPLNVKSSPPKNSPKTPSARVSEKKRKIAECGSSNAAPNYATTSSGKENGMSSKRRRKGWSGLREITMSSERDKEQRMNNLAIPFLM